MFLTVKSIGFLIYGSLIFVFASYLKLANLFDKYFVWSQSDISDSLTYDYIVVGAGSAGSVVAARLSEAGEDTLLLEAGGRPPPFLNIPIVAPLLQSSVYDWRYKTEPQEHACKGLADNRSLWPMGKILGGSSRLNYMTHVVGHGKDYVGWFDDFREYSNDWLNSSRVNHADWRTDLSDAILGGVEELGEDLRDINADLTNGFMMVQLMSDGGERWSTDKLLSKDIEKLNIITNAFVRKVLFDADKAVGVRFEKLGTVLKAVARKGVILSAGAVGSPKLLMLSGIGPKSHLTDLKIEVINDLPVGQNLVDHVLTGLDMVILNTTLPLDVLNLLNPMSAFNYCFNGEGPWTSAGIEVVGTFYSDRSKDESNMEKSPRPPDLQLMTMPVGISQDGGVALRKILGIPDEIYQDYYAPLIDETAVSILPVLLHPKSTGEIKLRSNDPYDHPIIDPKYLSCQEDVDVLVDGIGFVKKLLRTGTMRKLGAEIYRKHYPGCKEYSFDSKEYWECYVRHVTLTSYHPAGTCRIGSIVDEYFRVYGTKNLYVVDASILPVLPSGNINAAVLMLAEKAARLLIEDDGRRWKKSKCDLSDLIVYLFQYHRKDNYSVS